MSTVDTVNHATSAAPATPSTPKEAAVAAIFKMGHWDSQYTELVINTAPKLASWPAGRGLVMHEKAQARLERYDAEGSKPLETSDIDSHRDVVVERVSNRYFNLMYPGMELMIPQNGDGFFRAVLAGVHASKIDDPMEELIGDLRAEMASYVDEHWDELEQFVGQGERLNGEGGHEPLRTTRPQSQVAPGMTQAMEMLHQASGVGKPSYFSMLMNQVQMHLSCAMDALRGSALSEKDLQGLAASLKVANRTIAGAPQAEKTEWINRSMQALFATDARHPVSKAQTLLAHRHLPALAPVAQELMTFMERSAQYLEGDALAHFGQLLGVDITAPNKDRAIARSFSEEGATSELGARFAKLRDEFGMAF